MAPQMHNMPAVSQQLYEEGKSGVWRRLHHAEPMSEVEIKRAWPGVMDCIRRPALAATPRETKRATVEMLEYLRDLVERGFPLDAAPFGPSIAAVVAGMGPSYLPLLTRLFFSGANLQLRNTSDGSLPIEVAAAMGHEAVVDRLLKMGCGVGRALHCALNESQFASAIVLLDHVDVNLRWDGISPLEWAVLSGNKQAALWLLEDETHPAKIDRPLSRELCERCELATGSSLVHLCAKIGGTMEDVLTTMLSRSGSALKEKPNHAGLSPQQVRRSSGCPSPSPLPRDCSSVLA